MNTIVVWRNNPSEESLRIVTVVRCTSETIFHRYMRTYFGIDLEAEDADIDYSWGSAHYDCIG